MKENAEKIQRIRLNLDKDEINDMAGDFSAGKDKYEINLKDDQSVKSEGKEEEEEDEMEELESDDEELEEIEDDEDFELEEIDEEEAEDGKETNVKLIGKKRVREAKEELDDILDIESNEEESEMVESHSFVDENEINNYKLTYRQKRDKLKNEEKEEFKMNRKTKKGGKTNEEQKKNKPMAMIIHKVKRDKRNQESAAAVSRKIKNIKRQLGRFKRGNMVLKKKGGASKKTKKK